MVWAPDPESLNNKEALSGNTRISLGIDFVLVLGVDRVGKRSDNIGRNDWNWWALEGRVETQCNGNSWNLLE